MRPLTHMVLPSNHSFMSMLRSIWSGQSPTRPVKVMKWTMNTCSGNGGPKSRNSGLKLSACLVPVTAPHTVCSSPTCPAASDGFKADATASAVAASAAGSRVGVGSGDGRCRPALGTIVASPAVGSPSPVNPHPMATKSSQTAAAIPRPGIQPRFVPRILNSSNACESASSRRARPSPLPPPECVRLSPATGLPWSRQGRDRCPCPARTA